MYNELKLIKYEFEKLRELYSELKSCCNNNAESVANHNLEKHVERILFNYFPGLSKEDLAKIGQDLLASYNREGFKLKHRMLILFFNHIHTLLMLKIIYIFFFDRSNI